MLYQCYIICQMTEKHESLELYSQLYHGTAALLQPGDYLIPRGQNVANKHAVFATTDFPKAAACALLSQRGLQNKTIGNRYHGWKAVYCYLFDRQSQNLILHPSFHWDDAVPVFVYQVEKAQFQRISMNNNEYISYMPAKIEAVDTIITPEHFNQNGVGLYVAKSEDALADLVAIYEATLKRFGLRREIMDALCTRII